MSAYDRRIVMKKNGFTLIEGMTVLVIIGIFISVLWPALVAITSNSPPPTDTTGKWEKTYDPEGHSYKVYKPFGWTKDSSIMHDPDCIKCNDNKGVENEK